MLALVLAILSPRIQKIAAATVSIGSVLESIFEHASSAKQDNAPRRQAEIWIEKYSKDIVFRSSLVVSSFSLVAAWAYFVWARFGGRGALAFALVGSAVTWIGVHGFLVRYPTPFEMEKRSPRASGLVFGISALLLVAKIIWQTP